MALGINSQGLVRFHHSSSSFNMGLRESFGILLLLLGTSLILAQTDTEHPFVIFAPRQLKLGQINDLTLVCESDNIAAFDVTIQLRWNSTEVLYSQEFRKSGSSLQDGQVTLKFTPPANLRGGYNLTAEVEVRTRDRRRVSYFAHTRVSPRREQTNFVYIQLDKPIYKPNELVNYRIVAVKPDLTPLTSECNIKIEDPSTNRIDDIRNVELENGVSSHSFRLSDQPNLGSWSITVSCMGGSETKRFKVEEYVLPKFEVKLEAPDYVLLSDQRIKVKFNAQYTFGKGVDGTAHISFRDSNTLSRWYRGQWDPISRKYLPPPTVEFKDVELDDGKGEVEINMKQLHYVFNCERLYDSRELVVIANVTETLTGIVRPGQAKIKFSTRIESLEFVAAPTNFKAGFDYTGFLKLSRKDGGVVQNPKRANISVTYYTGYSSTINELCTDKWIENDQAVENHLDPVFVTFPENGIAEFRIRIPEEAVHRINLQATYMDGSESDIVQNLQIPKGFYRRDPLRTSHNAQQALSQTNNFIQVGMRSGTAVKAGERVEFKIDVSDSRATVYYHILARGEIVLFNHVNLEGRNSKIISFDVTTEMAPSANIFVYYILEDADELIVDSLSFKVSGIFKHNVSLNFSDSKVAPGNSVSLTVKSQPRSFVGVVAVDQSVLLLGEGNDISQDDVSEDVNSHFSGGSYWSWKYYSWWYRPIYGSDAKEMIRNAGLAVLTNTLVYDEREDILRRRESSSRSFSGSINGNFNFGSSNFVSGRGGPSADFNANSNSRSSLAPVARVRKSFPETWIWYNGTASLQGESVINAVVPDTITSWVASAFALDSRLGLGIADSSAEITVFKQFFVSLNLPYSVVRGEELVLQAIVFNYLDDDVRVRVSLPRSDQFESIKVDTRGRISYVSTDETVEIIAKAGQGTSVYLPIVPRKVGEMILEVSAQAPNAADAVVRRLIVEPEGVERSYTRNVLIDKRNASTANLVELQQTVKLDVPEHAIPDSKRIGFSLVGSILGASIENLAHLIRMPYGCGEQNLMTFATTLYVTEYLDKAGVLTTEQKTTSRSYLSSGYMRQLTYQRSDGSFSAFGGKDSRASLFLTAYVLKVFQRAMETKYVYIDPSVVNRAASWVLSQQQRDGSFYYRSRGFFGFSSGGRYGVESNVTTTAFVLSALGEVKKNVNNFQDQRLENGTSQAQRYLVRWFNSSGDYTEPNRFYHLALTSYALKLTGSRIGDQVLDKLLTYAQNDGGLKFWEVHSRPEEFFSRRPWWGRWRYQSVEVELASYALLTYSLRGSTRNPSPALDGLPTLKWITNQRNGYGGFISTQDTVVALQALSAYALYFSGEPDLSVILDFNTTSAEYTIDRTNKLVLQQRTLPVEVTEASLSASGRGLALGMFTVSYNEEEDEVDPSFNTTAEVKNNGEHSLSVSICTKWLLENSTGMAVMEIGVPSGFSTSEENLKVTQMVEVLDDDNSTVIEEQRGSYKRFENADRKFILYFDKIGQLDTCVHFTAQRTGLVAKSQPVAVRVYDYYDPEKQQTIFYSSQLLKDTTICDVCPDCKNCNILLSQQTR